MFAGEPIAVTLQAVAALDAAGCPYFIGGSLATMIHGVVRSTIDVDLVADISLPQIEPLVRALEANFFVDEEMVRAAVQRQGSFNIIHRTTIFKVDVFIKRTRPFDRSQFERREQQPLASDEARRAYVATPEDNILAKLEWYRLGGEVSDRQWQDIVNVMRLQRGRLDRAYLLHWAAQLKVGDLLERALNEAQS